MKYLALLAAMIPGLASANIAQRCTNVNDWLTNDTDSHGRNAWAVKCGYINSSTQNFLNLERMYITFTDGASNPIRAPIRQTDACVSGLLRLGFCYTGCYTPGQRLTFGGEFIGVQHAYEQGMMNVTALTPASSQSVLSYGEQAIKSYVAGDTEEQIYVLKTEDGRRVEVTSTHPMVRGTGEVVKAQELKAGDALMGADGKQTKLEQVSTFLFKGKVWNVLPFSEEKLENIFNAEGLLSGSIRFQNQWGDDNYRLSLRDDLQISAQ